MSCQEFQANHLIYLLDKNNTLMYVTVKSSSTQSHIHAHTHTRINIYKYVNQNTSNEH